MTHPTPFPLALAQARRIVAQPCAADSPSLRLVAFAALKAAAGQTVAQHRLHAMQRAAGISRRALLLERFAIAQPGGRP
jgi:hypothetical protein